VAKTADTNNKQLLNSASQATNTAVSVEKKHRTATCPKQDREAYVSFWHEIHIIFQHQLKISFVKFISPSALRMNWDPHVLSLQVIIKSLCKHRPIFHDMNPLY
jgi:hypothetical protein